MSEIGGCRVEYAGYSTQGGKFYLLMIELRSFLTAEFAEVFAESRRELYISILYLCVSLRLHFGSFNRRVR